MKLIPWLIIGCLALALAGATVYNQRKMMNRAAEVACTMEARLCPDGSYVGREGPNCEFAACPVSQGTTTTPATLGVIVGKVLLSPICPVERMPPEPSCAPKGYSTEVEARVPGSGAVAARVTSSEDGSYMFTLPPGTYEVHAKGGDMRLPTCESGVVVVSAEKTTELLISCDTGIR